MCQIPTITEENQAAQYRPPKQIDVAPVRGQRLDPLRLIDYSVVLQSSDLISNKQGDAFE